MRDSALRSGLLLSALLILLSGCSSPGSDVPVVADEASTTNPQTQGMVAAAEAELVAATPEPVTKECRIQRTHISTSLGYGVNVDRAVSGIEECDLAALFGDLAWSGSALVEVTWSPGAGVSGADAWVESDACRPAPLSPCEPRASSPTSPLSMPIEGDVFAAHRDAGPLVLVGAEGAAVQQEFVATITLFAEPQVPLGFSALG